MKKTKKTKKTKITKPVSAKNLFDRVVSILEQARANVVRSVNSNMTLAYWHVGQEIVLELQGGEERAEYGKRILADLSERLTKKYGEGFSITSLKYFRTFYITYADRIPKISRPTGDQLSTDQKGRPLGDQLEKAQNAFHPNLSWSHYRALMRVENEKARDFYETEALRCGWNKRALERQISTLFYERILKSRDKAGMLKDAVSTHKVEPVEVLKEPFILEFLGLPNSPKLRESKLEEALIANLQYFLLELGRGFSFVARQKHIRIGNKDFYVDLVFYNYQLKCFVLIDLKVGDLTHQDIGQMDAYVRMYEE